MTIPSSIPLQKLETEIELKKQSLASLIHISQVIHEVNENLAHLTPHQSGPLLSVSEIERFKSYALLAYKLQSEEIFHEQEQEILRIQTQAGKIKAQAYSLQEQSKQLQTLITKVESLVQAKNTTVQVSEKLFQDIHKK